MEKNAQQLSIIMTAQIVHELRNLPRGTVRPEAILLMETAYKQASGLEDLLKAAYTAMKEGA